MGWKTRSLTIAFAALLVATFFIYFTNNNNNNKSSFCEFPAIYNFGDSNADTGGAAVVFKAIPYPYGMTYFHKPSGRFSDGRLIIDFIAEKLGLPFLSAYVDSIGTNFRHGANFALSGATIQLQDAVSLNKTFGFITLTKQLFQHQEFKKRASALYLEAKSNELKARLPRPEDYTRALYAFDIGQNDLHGGLLLMQEEVMEYIPDMINNLSSVVKQLYEEGARKFWIQNTGPIGCMPFFVKNYPPAPGNADKRGCVESYNKVAQEFNKQLEDEVSKLGSQLQESTLLYADVYSLKYSLISEPTKHGFADILSGCISIKGNAFIPCDNPSKLISWDGIHYTDAVNKWVVDHLQDGFVNVYGIPLTESCWPVSGSHRQEHTYIAGTGKFRGVG